MLARRLLDRVRADLCARPHGGHAPDPAFRRSGRAALPDGRGDRGIHHHGRHPGVRDPARRQLLPARASARPHGRPMERADARMVDLLAAATLQLRLHAGRARPRRVVGHEEARLQSTCRRLQADRSGVPRHARAVVPAARPRTRLLADAQDRDVQPGSQLQGARHGDGGGRGRTRRRDARRVRERREPRSGAGLQRRASRVGGHGRRRKDGQPLQAAPDRGLRRRHPARRGGHRGRARAGAGDRGRGRRLPGRGQPGPRHLRRAPRRSASSSSATIRDSTSSSSRSAAERWPAASATSCARPPATSR